MSYFLARFIASPRDGGKGTYMKIGNVKLVYQPSDGLKIEMYQQQIGNELIG